MRARDRDLAQSEVRAPIAGVVLEIDIRPGERPGSDGLMTLGRTDRMMARVEVFQTEIGRVREGQGVELTAAPLATPLTGRMWSASAFSSGGRTSSRTTRPPTPTPAWSN
jgi:HlyD family secretion protein